MSEPKTAPKTEPDLFEYSPGDRSKRFADPFEIHHKLVLAFQGLGGRTEEGVLGLWNSENPVQKAQAVEIIDKVSRQVFGLIPFNGMTGDGCTPYHSVKIYWDFWDFCNQKKTTGGTRPTSPTSSDSTPSNSLSEISTDSTPTSTVS